MASGADYCGICGYRNDQTSQDRQRYRQMHYVLCEAGGLTTISPNPAAHMVAATTIVVEEAKLWTGVGSRRPGLAPLWLLCLCPVLYCAFLSCFRSSHLSGSGLGLQGRGFVGRFPCAALGYTALRHLGRCMKKGRRSFAPQPWLVTVVATLGCPVLA